MIDSPRHASEYGARQVKAARRVLVDLGHVLDAWRNCVVLVGGWVPDLLIKDPDEAHVGSIDVDLALDVAGLGDGRYADLIGALFATRRYHQGEKAFQLVSEVGLGDDKPTVRVNVDFLAPKSADLERHAVKLVPGFRIQTVDGCGAAFRDPLELTLSGSNVLGMEDIVHLRILALVDFLVMKALAIGGRDKPKDCYDLCYCLDYAPEGLASLARGWQARRGEADVERAITVMQEKFRGVRTYGPQQVVEFYAATDSDTRDMQARRALELVRRFLELLEDRP